MSAPKKSAGTPGPWFIDRRASDSDVIEILALDDDGKATVVAEVCGSGEITDVERADARRIAAAPDLERALRNIEAEDDLPEAVRKLAAEALEKVEPT